MQGTWKTKKKYFQKDKFKQIVKTIRYLNPQEFKEPLKVNFFKSIIFNSCNLLTKLHKNLEFNIEKC